MLFRHRGRTSRRPVVATCAAAVAAVCLAGSALPAQASASKGADRLSALAGPSVRSGAGGPVSPSSRIVTLITGDRVVLRTDAAGRSLASFTPHSPHAHGAYLNAAFHGHQYVVPRLPASERGLFDPSLFDVAALAGQTREALDVTFAKNASSRSLPGLSIRSGSARTGAAGRTTVVATYNPSRPLPAGFAAALGSVARIQLHDAVQPTVDPAAYVLHPLTIDATGVRGAPLRFAFVFVINMDDGRLFGAFSEIVNGQWKVQVPSGHYVVMVDDFNRLGLTQTDVEADTTASVSMADATVKPKMSFPGHEALLPEVDVLLQDEAGTSGASFGFGGFTPRLTPVSQVVAGHITTEVGNQWTTKGFDPFSFDNGRPNPIKMIANAKETRPNIPSRLTFSYDESDFAVVHQRFYATGDPVNTSTGWVGFTPADSFLFFFGFPTAHPGKVKTLFLARPNVQWLTNTDLTSNFRRFASISSVQQYPKPVRTSEPFFRGPITPVPDRGLESNGSGVFCSLCVKNGKLRGFLPTLVTAGTTQTGFADLNRWALVRLHGRRFDVLSRGRTAIVPRNVPVTAGESLVLVAQNRREEDKQLLSTRIDDIWRFRVPSANGAVPMLRADYVPPTNLRSVGRTGMVRFPITFNNLGPVDARVSQASVRFSTDGGRSWHAADLSRRDKNTFVVSYLDPASSRGHRFLSLRVKARDAQGRSIEESVKNAYVLPKAGHRQGTGSTSATASTSTTATTSPGTSHRTFRPNRLCASRDHSQYSCFVSLDRRTLSAGKASPDPQGWGAPAIRDAYDLPSTGADTTVAVVVAFDYPSAEADMNRYRRQFGLPACTSASGCFTKINQNGETANYPRPDVNWGVEASLDLQMISTACPTCHIVLAEAKQPTDRALGKATVAAANAGATVTNHSYGRNELTGDDTADGPYSLPGVTAVVASGDFGYEPAQFPASSPHVVSVGGTTLQRTLDARGWAEKAWAFGGSGCSAYFGKPAWQTDQACPGRTATDVSAVARGLAIFNTSVPRRFRGWLEVDGTSASSPLIAGMIGSAGGGGLTPDQLYTNTADFNDVVAGSNGFCQGSYMCTALPGYDAPTGLGTPEGVTAFQLP